MNGNELLERIYKELPETRDKLTFEHILYRKSDGMAYFSLLSDVCVFDRGYLAIKRIIHEAFPQLKFSVRVASPALAEDFLQHPDSYAMLFNAMMRRSNPSITAWEYDMVWKPDNGERVALELPDEFAVKYLSSQGLREKLENAVYDVFRIHAEVLFRLRGDNEARVADAERERRAAEEIERLRLERMSELNAQKKAEEGAKKPEPSPRIKGRQIADKPVPINELTNDTGLTTIQGKVLSVETKEISKGEGLLLTFAVTDFTGTIRCKMFLYFREKVRLKDENEQLPPISEEQRKQVNDIVCQIKEGMGLIVRGTCQYDNFAHETVIMARDLMRCQLEERMDKAEKKRVELHLHTNMSNMDGIASASDLIARAAKWGHPAIAITDHGVVQSYPEAFGAAKKNNIKFIPGVEGYLTDDESIVKNATDRGLDEPIIVLDFETTGLNTLKDRIIEIGAVKLQNGHVTESFSMLVDPEQLLQPKIIEVTHINDAMLAGQPKAAEALPKLLEFMGDCPIAAHNANFDCSILRSELKRMGMTHDVPELDTLTFARKIYPALKSYKLGALCKHLSVSLKDAHRAVHDASATAQCLAQMYIDAKKRGANTLEDLNNISQGYTLGNSTHITLLATCQDGITNINHLVSEGHLKYFKKRPHMPRAVIQKYRKGLLVGSACVAGELFQAMLAGESDDKLCKIARFYDYLEIQPLGNNAFMIREGQAEDEDTLKNFNRKIVKIGEKLGIPVVATGDVHFMDPQDAIFRTIIQSAHGFDDADDQAPLYFKTTEEMLKEFSYLGKDKAYEVVVTNTNMIADKVGKVRLFPEHPEGKTTFSPYWETAADDIQNMTWDKAHEMYGDPLPDIVQKRLEKELKSIIGYGYATLYSIANKLVQKSLADGYLVGSRGSVGSSLVACMSGITEVNALPPHYRCAHCHKGFFDVPKEYTVGVDLPDKNCPDCGQKLLKDGFDIPFEVFLGFKGDKVPDIDLNFSGEYRPTANAFVENLFGKGNVFRAGTIGTLAEKTAFGYVLKYLETHNMTVSEAEKARLAHGCEGVKRTTGQHPAGMVILPKPYDICQFTAIQHPADDAEGGIITTHYDFGSMHDVLVKLDILGHDDPTMIHMLGELTGINFKDVPLDDKKVMSLFLSPDALGVTPEQLLGCKTGTFGVPEFGTSFVRQVLDDTKPTTMEELIRISGLSHGTDVWVGNAKDLVTSGTATLKKCICTRDDIMNALIGMGLESKISFDTMESVRKGKGLKPEMESAMHENNVPEWFIDSCKKIKYMFPKGHAVAYVTMALRVAWFKVYYPLAYYAAYYTVRGDGFEATKMALPYDKLRDLVQSYYDMESQDRTGHEKEELVSLELALEMAARGYHFLPIDLYKSDAKKFLIEDGAIRLPFSSLGGLGEAAAESIVAARNERPFLSVDDLKARGKVGSATVDMLRDHGTLNGLPESSQVTLFQMLG